jgi:hypothetical protein
VTSTSAVFTETVAKYFPRWRAWKRWRLVIGVRRGAASVGAGYCDATSRTVYVNRTPGSSDFLVTLIHEICHAVASTGHGKAFLVRLRAAADTAEARGDSALAAALRAEADGYESPLAVKPSAASVYGEIRDIVSVSEHEPSLGEVVRFVANENGYTVRELRSKYRRIDREFARAMSDRREDRTRQAEMRAKIELLRRKVG